MTTPQRFLIPLLACGCLGLGIYAHSERAARLAAEDRHYSAQAENARLTTPAASRAELPAPGPEPVPPTATIMSVDPGPAPADGRRGAFGGRPPGAEFTTMKESPEMQQLMTLRARGALDGRYAGLFKLLGLPADQLARFQELLLDKQNTTRDVLAAMRSQGLAPGRESAEQMRTLIESANAELDTQIRAALGETAFAQYQTYEQTQPQRALVERVQQRLSYTSTPLTDQQAASLVNLLAQNTAPTGSTPRALGPRFSSGSSSVPITDTVLTQAQSVLSPAQLTALQQLQQEQEAQAQLMRQARRNLNPSPSTPTTGR